MQTKLLIIILSLLAFAPPAFAQAESRKLFDVKLNETPCDDIKGYLDSVSIQLQNDPTARLYIIFYGGKGYFNMIWNAKRKEYEWKYLLPKRGEATARISFWKPYLMNTRRIDGSRIEVIDGGYRENPIVEMWIVPFGAKRPVPTPTLTEREIKFRRGKLKRIKMFGEGCG